MELILKVENISKQFSNTLALDNVNMTINRGDIYGFVGENGAGKSTLIRLITKVINPTKGKTTLNVEKRLGSVAAIVETPALHPKLSATNNLLYQAELLNIVKTNEDINALLTLVGLESEINNSKHSRNFSLGMKQRLAIAMALIGNPEFIILDEPMNGLDPVGIKDIRELILKLNKEEGKTFLISSHILTELDKIATVYGFITKGRLVKEIRAKELHEMVTGYTKITLIKPLDENIKESIKNFNYKEESSTILIVEDALEGQKLMQSLVKNDVVIAKFDEVKETIEDYYFKIIAKGETILWNIY